MAAICSKSYSISVMGLSPAAWWSFESVGATIPDVAGASTLSLTLGAAATTAAGKVNLAVDKTTNSTRYDTGPRAPLAWNGGDVNVFGWTRLTSPGLSVLTQQVISMLLDDIAFKSFDLTFRGNNTWRFDDQNGLVLSGALALGAFVFWRVHYNSATQKWGVAFNGAAPMYEAGTSPLTLGANGDLTLWLNGSFLDVGNNQQCDELCVFMQSMSAAEIASIYNGGLGRTFP